MILTPRPSKEPKPILPVSRRLSAQLWTSWFVQSGSGKCIEYSQAPKVSSNFERLLWYLAYETQTPQTISISDRKRAACLQVEQWQSELKAKGGFRVGKEILDLAKADFSSERVSDTETLSTIHDIYRKGGYILDPHSSIGVTAALRSAEAAPGVFIVALATAHPAKFSVSCR